MYIIDLYYKNMLKNGSGRMLFGKYRNTLSRWTLINSDKSSTELLRILALAVGGPNFLNRTSFDFTSICGNKQPQVEVAIAPHYPYDNGCFSHLTVGSGIFLNSRSNVEALPPKKIQMLPSDLPKYKLNISGSGNTCYFFLAYGSGQIAHNGTDNFDFINPYFRLSRFHSLFDPLSCLTDPIAFLTRLNKKSTRFARFPAIQTMKTMCYLFETYLKVDTSDWNNKKFNPSKAWLKLPQWKQRILLPVIDAIRHIMDAFPHSGTPLDMPGVIVLDRPDLYCTQSFFPSWIALLDNLLPKIQFIITLSNKFVEVFPKQIKKQRLKFFSSSNIRKNPKLPRLPRQSILLIDVDSRLPNLGLMKLSSYFKAQGEKIIMRKNDHCEKGAKAVFASCIFYNKISQKRIKKLKQYYGDALILGGSGVDLNIRLPAKIEKMPADYSLYPELNDRAIGFITRGCTKKCPFCVVPLKEGNIRQVNDFDDLLDNGQKKLILLDDNLLAHQRSTEFLEEMINRNLSVNFTQTLDIRMVNKKKADLLKKIHCTNTKFSRRNYHFSLNDIQHLELIRKKYQLFNFTPRDNVEFICMYGFNTTLSQDIERFRFLRSLPGAYVFVQQYRPIQGGPTPSMEHFFEQAVDELINELIQIIFPQNMKSMEKYYRWLSRLYVEKFGKLHDNLVDTLFRYNYRDRKGRYIATMAGTIPRKKLNQL